MIRTVKFIVKITILTIIMTTLVFVLYDILKSYQTPQTPIEPVDNNTDTILVAPTSADDVIPIDGTQIEPVIYTNTFPLNQLDPKEKKETFIAMMLPSILLAKKEMRNDRERLLTLSQTSSLTPEDQKWLDDLYEKYKTTNTDTLLKRLQPYPTSIVLAQAALESGWGTSRFFQKANNIFGVWSFDPDEKRVAATQKRGDQTVYLKKYNALYHSIDDYFMTLSTGPYQSFRDARMECSDPFELIKYLGGYSELGDQYVGKLKTVIEANDLTKYDVCRLGPVSK